MNLMLQKLNVMYNVALQRLSSVLVVVFSMSDTCSWMQ